VENPTPPPAAAPLLHPHRGRGTPGTTLFEPKKVYVGGLPYEISDEDLVYIFEECGRWRRWRDSHSRTQGASGGSRLLTFQVRPTPPFAVPLCPLFPVPPCLSLPLWPLVPLSLVQPSGSPASPGCAGRMDTDV